MKLRAAAVVMCAFVVAFANGTVVGAQTDNVKAAIDGQNKKFGAAVAAGDAAAIAAMYTEDATMLPPNAEPVKGRAAVQKAWQENIAGGVKGLALTATEVESHGDTAHEVGAYSVKDAAGKEIDRGKYLVVWKRQQGQWKLHRDIWNSSVPTPPQK